MNFVRLSTEISGALDNRDHKHRLFCNMRLFPVPLQGRAADAPFSILFNRRCERYPQLIHESVGWLRSISS